MINIFTISGPIGAGKSTVARIIFDYVSGSTIIPMAESLKETARSLGWDGQKDDAGRRFLQDLGSGMRQFDETYWLQLWTQKALAHAWHVNKHQPGVNPIVIVDDVRYTNEFEYLAGWPCVRLKVTGHEAPVARGDLKHESEVDWQHVDYTHEIVNDGDIETLRNRVLSIVKEMQ